MVNENYTFSLDEEIMKRFKKNCIDLNIRFSTQVLHLISEWNDYCEELEHSKKHKEKETKD